MDIQTVATLRPADQTAAWIPVLASDRLQPEQGRCVLLHGVQIAIFRVDEELFALTNIDPFSGAPVLSRGIVGSSRGEPKVASPMYKQSFALRTGVCIDDPTVSVRTYAVREHAGFVEVAV